jgi:hypothetical protein
MEQGATGNSPNLFFIQVQSFRQDRRKRRNPLAVTPCPRVPLFQCLAPSHNRGIRHCGEGGKESNHSATDGGCRSAVRDALS